MRGWSQPIAGWWSARRRAHPARECSVRHERVCPGWPRPLGRLPRARQRMRSHACQPARGGTQSAPCGDTITPNGHGAVAGASPASEVIRAWEGPPTHSAHCACERWLSDLSRVCVALDTGRQSLSLSQRRLNKPGALPWKNAASERRTKAASERIKLGGKAQRKQLELRWPLSPLSLSGRLVVASAGGLHFSRWSVDPPVNPRQFLAFDRDPGARVGPSARVLLRLVSTVDCVVVLPGSQSA